MTDGRQPMKNEIAILDQFLIQKACLLGGPFVGSNGNPFLELVLITTLA